MLVAHGKINRKNPAHRLPKSGRNLLVKSQSRAWHCFIILCLSMFLNLILAVAHARGVPVTNGIVTALQMLVTLVAVPAALSPQARLPDYAYNALGFVLFSVVLTNLLNPFNPKTIYDIVLIPIYMGLGMSAVSVKPKWMHGLLIFVLASALLELLLPGIYQWLVDPLGYLSATRDWLEGVNAGNGSGGDSLNWVNRAGGSKLGISDHRVGGAFLEPLSLGYFGALMAIYYSGLYRGPWKTKVAAIIACLALTLFADSRIPTMLILLLCPLLLLRVMVPSVLLWFTFPVVITLAGLFYAFEPGALYSDMGLRLSLTFNVFQESSFGEILTGGVSLQRAADSGIVYLLRCVGPLGLLMAIWFFSGAFSRRHSNNMMFFVAISVYLAVTLLFGGATLSIKTASLLGYLVGMATSLGYAPQVRAAPAVPARSSSSARFQNRRATPAGWKRL
jgi:hypothetical protein